MAHVYSITFNAIAVTAVQDLLTLEATSVSMLEILSARLGQTTDYGDAAAEGLRVRWVRHTAVGSAGATVTPVNHSAGGEAATGTYRRNDTTQGAGSVVIMEDVWNIQAGWLYVPIPEERIWVPPSGTGNDVLSLTLPAAPADSVTMSGSITFIQHR